MLGWPMLDERYSTRVLAERIDPVAAERQRQACVAHWGQDFANSAAGREASEFVVFRRHDNTVRFLIPWIERHQILSGQNIIDFGGGCGSSALAFSHYAEHVDTFEIDTRLELASRTRMELFGAPNVSFYFQPDPGVVFEKALSTVGPKSIVVLVAVVEHLLDGERIEYLREFWSRLRPGGLLVIAETPNLYSVFDDHTFQRPYSHLIPDHFFRRWVEDQPASLRFREALLAASDHGDQALFDLRRRLGLGATPELFQQAFGHDLNELVIADGYDPEMVSWFPISPDDQLMLSAFDMYSVGLPVGFAKNVLSFIFQKPLNGDHAAEVKAQNVSRRERAISRFSLVRERDRFRSELERSRLQTS